MLRVVIDTNVIVSGVIGQKGAPIQILKAWRERRFLLVSSPAIVAEVRIVLRYPQIRKKYPIAEQEVDEIIALLEHETLLVPGNSNVAGSIPADPKDEMFLSCALDGEVDLIISGDHHLLDLGFYQSIPIVSARQFLEQLESE
jgi:hypothetical protein